jgi:hypothetical protein
LTTESLTQKARQYELRSRVMYSNASKINAVPNVLVSRDDWQHDLEFRRARKLYLQGRSTIEQYLEDILDIFRFEPKKKFLEKLVDTDLSDSTDTDLTSTIFSERNEDQFNMGIVEGEGAGTGLARAEEEEAAAGDMMGDMTGGRYDEGGVAETNMYADMDMDNSRLDQDDDVFHDDEEEAARLLEMSFDLFGPIPIHGSCCGSCCC